MGGDVASTGAEVSGRIPHVRFVEYEVVGVRRADHGEREDAKLWHQFGVPRDQPVFVAVLRPTSSTIAAGPIYEAEKEILVTEHPQIGQRYRITIGLVGVDHAKEAP